MINYLKSTDINIILANLYQLVFEITDACNLKCKYCSYGEFYDDYDNRENKLLPIEKAIRLIDYLVQLWNSDMNMSSNKNIFISFYGGEPLLNMPFIKSVVNYVENKIDCPNRNIAFSMTTNALLLDRHMDYLYEHKIGLLISLDGDEENMVYRVDKCGNSVFDRIINNVNLLKKKYPYYFNEYVNFNAVLHNKNSVEEIHRFFKEKYNKIPRIGELNGSGIRKDKQAEFMQTYRNARESLQQAEHYEEIEKEMFMKSASYQQAATFLHQNNEFVYHDYTDLLFEKSIEKKIPTGTCLPFARKMFITVNGKILPCERIGHQFTLGEITDTEIRLDTEAIAEKYNNYYDKIERQCGKCKNKSCIQCIFNLNNLDTQPVCYGFMNEETHQKYVKSQMNFFIKNPEAYKKLMTDVISI
jgi:uncharacterized protein